jgi:hypothetical protein
VIEIQKICSILLFNSEDNWNFPTPNAYQINLTTNTTSSVLAYLLAKKSTFPLKFRLYSRCLAISILKQISFDTDSNHFKLRMTSSDDQYLIINTPLTNGQNQTQLSLLNLQIKQATTNFSSINQTKQYISFIEHVNYTNTLCKTKEFCFPQIIEIIKYLNLNIFGESFYLY